MRAALAPRDDSRTFLTHFVGSGPDDDRYVVERYLSQADGDIVPVDAHGARPKGRRRPRPTAVSPKEGREPASGNSPKAVRWELPSPCLHGFIAVVTYPRICDLPSSREEALDQLDAWVESPVAELLVETGAHRTVLKK